MPRKKPKKILKLPAALPTEEELAAQDEQNRRALRAMMTTEDREAYDFARMHMAALNGSSSYAKNRAVAKEIADKYRQREKNETEDTTVVIIWDERALDEAAGG